MWMGKTFETRWVLVKHVDFAKVIVTKPYQIAVRIPKLKKAAGSSGLSRPPSTRRWELLDPSVFFKGIPRKAEVQAEEKDKGTAQKPEFSLCSIPRTGN